MWVNKQLFEMIVNDNKRMQLDNQKLQVECAVASNTTSNLRAQKAKDDLSIDWLRHRVNALEKQNAVLLQKATGVAMPVPEIVSTRPGSLSVPPADFDHMPDFEDVGDEAAKRLGISHDEHGNISFGMPQGRTVMESAVR